MADTLQLRLQKDSFTNAKDLIAFALAQRESEKGNVRINKDHWSFNTDEFQALLDDYRAMKRKLKELDVTVEWKAPPKKKRVTLDDSDIPSFVKGKGGKMEQVKESKKRVRL